MLRRQRGEDIGRIFIETPVEITDIIKTQLSPWVGKREKKNAWYEPKSVPDEV